jgi:hypothetical protein
MATRTVTSLERLLDRIEKQDAPLTAESLELVAGEIAKLFVVEPDEVAILELVPAGKSLKFVLPGKLQVVGTIPLSSTSALAARTVRERRSDIVNKFSLSRHASVFEGVPLGRRQNETIQKIMSAPIVSGDKVIGVVQISRKGDTPLDCGPDFVTKDMHLLQELHSLLVRFLTITREK